MDSPVARISRDGRQLAWLAWDHPTADGAQAHACVHLPANPDVQPPPGSAPPLLVEVHGGPTWRASPAYSLDVQYWTSRGFAVADVDYRGSSGYGRAFRQLLNGHWGVVDVAGLMADTHKFESRYLEFGFTPAEQLEPLELMLAENLPDS